MKTLCRECHERFCTARDAAGCLRRANEFVSGPCDYCGKFIEVGIDCTHYDFRKACGPFIARRNADGTIEVA